MDIYEAGTESEVRACYPIMAQLRTHLSEDDFVQRVLAQRAEGYRLAYVEEVGTVCSVAGFRIIRTLASGKVLFLDDLVTDERKRSAGYGDRMMVWLLSQARAEKCDTLELQSRVHRQRSHRFYFRQGMHIDSFHFSVTL
jgi:GNAT superfamily N-acetyltransferase